MKHNNIFKTAALALVTVFLAAACEGNGFEEITELNLARCLEPQNLSARVDAATGDYVTFGWDVNRDAESYNLVVYTDEAMTAEALNTVVAPSEVPYTVRLTADQKYYFKVQALADKKNASHWAVYDGSCKTYAVKDNLFLEVSGISNASVSLKWANDASDYTEVTHITATPVKGGEAVTIELTDAQKNAASATVEGLSSSAEYQVVLYYHSASRGAVDVWTMAVEGSAVKVSTSEELISMLTNGGDIYLSLAGSPYTVNNVKPAASVKLIGETASDGTKPVVIGKFELTGSLAEGSSIYAEGIKFDGGASNSRIVEHTGGAPVLGSVKFVNCEITNYLAGLFYDNNDNLVKMDELTFESCDIYAIPGSGGDAVDIRKATEITSMNFINNTIYNGIRTFFRIDANNAINIGTINFQNNTVKNIATMDDGNNRGIFAIRVATNMTLKKNLFLYEDGGKRNTESEKVTDRAQLFQINAATVVPTLDASGNYSFASGQDFFNKVSASEAGFTELDKDPCYNSKGNFFQLSNEDLIDAKVGASKWWISYVERVEDLTQHVVPAPHTWDLQNATLFAGDIKNSRVRDELMMVASEEVPMAADGGIIFLSASELTRRGVPTDGYLSFLIDTPGSVDLQTSDSEGAGSSVVVALYDDEGLTVLGGSVPSAKNPEVQKILVPELNGEGTIYLYSTGAVKLEKLAWSPDTKGGSRVLASPAPKVEPVTVSEGDETPVTVTWDAVDNAASYVVVFNKKAYPKQSELSFTVPAEDVAALKAGLYNFTVTAHPAETDIYYTASEEGSASMAIQPKSSGGEVVEVTLTWDFSLDDWQKVLSPYGEAGKDIPNWNVTVDGLTWYSPSNSRWNTTYIQSGNAGNTSDRYFKFNAPAAGTLKVVSSNTGGSDAPARGVTVNVGGVEDSKYGGSPSGTPTENEFAVGAAGDVYIYAYGGGLRFYKIEFTYTTGGEVPPAVVEYTWDFSLEDWQKVLSPYGEAGKDIPNWNVTVDGLTWYSPSNSRWNTTYIQSGNAGSTSDRYFKFTAPAAGTLKIVSSNTGGSDAPARGVTVNVGGVEESKYGGSPSGTPTENEFKIGAAGDVYIYAYGGGLRFYSIYYINQ